jgi:hypothetical protein
VVDAGAEGARSIVAAIRRMMEARGVQRHTATGLDFYTGYGSTLYDWELYFDALALAYLGCSEYSINGIRIFLAQQRSDGFIRRNSPGTGVEANPYDALEAEEHCKPFLCQTALIVARLRGDADWLGNDDFIRLTDAIEHWLSAWDLDGNGLSEWASGPHSGADTQFARIGTWRSHYCQGVDLNCYLYRECLAAARLAEWFGLVDLATQLIGHADLKRRRIQELLWDDRDGFFYDRDARTGQHIRVRSASAFIPLWAGVATQDQARILVEQHLTEPALFWTPYPVASYARTEPDYTQYYKPPPDSDPLVDLGPGHANWCGGMWPHWNNFIVHGLAAYGFAAEASQIADRFYTAVVADPLLYEWYDAESGAGHGLHPFCAGASALGAFLPAELALGVDPTLIAAVDERLDLSPIRSQLDIEGVFTPS